MANGGTDRYSLLASYHGTERQIFVARSQVFVFSSSALVAFSSRFLPSLSPDSQWSEIVASLIVALLGLALCFGWWRAIHDGNWIVGRLREALVAYEEEVFGERELFRGVKRDPNNPTKRSYDRADRTWTFLVYFFLAFWLLIAGWTIGVIVLKASLDLEEEQTRPIVQWDRFVIIVLLVVLILGTLERYWKRNAFEKRIQQLERQLGQAPDDGAAANIESS